MKYALNRVGKLWNIKDLASGETKFTPMPKAEAQRILEAHNIAAEGEMVNYALRLPADVKEYYEREAEVMHTSLNSMIVRVLEGGQAAAYIPRLKKAKK